MMFDLTKEAPTSDEIGVELKRLRNEIKKLKVYGLAAILMLSPVFYFGLTEGKGWLLVSAFIALLIAVKLSSICDRMISDIRNEMNSLSISDDRDCLEIQHWLVDSVIAAYRDSVVGQGRLFVNGEVGAIRVYMAEAEDRRKVASARQAVYGNAVLGV